MRREVHFQIEDFVPAWASKYSEKKFTVFNTCFLSTKKNSHGLDIDEEVLRKDAKSILGNFLVAKLQYGDASTHLKDEVIYGYFPMEQEIVFEEDGEDENKVVKAKAYCVISKMYGKEFNDIFSYNNLRNTSVEMTVETEDEDENKVIDFDIYGLTCLGTTVNGSCPDANMKMVRFSQEEADEFFSKVHTNSLTALKKFVEERKESMTDKTYKIDKSKDAMSEAPWGDVDKTELRNKIMEAKNKSTLVKAVYMLIEDGWEDAPSEKLKYPVMQFKGDTLIYNRYGLSSALAYAEKEGESSVVSKVEAIYKKLGLGKEEDAKMTEIAFAAVNIGELWNNVWNVVHKHSDWRYSVEGIYEQDNKKFAILKDGEGNLYRLDFTLTEEEGLIASDTIVEVKQEFIETDDVKKFAEPENVGKYKKFEDDDSDDEDDDDDDKSDDDKDVEMSADEMKAEMAKMKSEIEDRDNIIMEKDKKMSEMEAELSELREYKAACEKKELATSVESIMAEVKDCMSEDKYKEFRDEGLTCKMSELDAWSNKVKAFCFENGKVNKSTKKSDIFSFAAPAENNQKPMNVWDRLKNL